MAIDYSIQEMLDAVSAFDGLAFSDRFYVEASFPVGVGDLRYYNLLCVRAPIPGKRIQTGEVSNIGHTRAFGYGFSNESEVNFTFYTQNGYELRKLTEEWMKMIIDPKTGVLGYKSDYAQGSWEVWQLDKGNNKTYGLKLLNIFPIEISGVELSNDSSGTIQTISLTMSYDHQEELTETT